MAARKAALFVAATLGLSITTAHAQSSDPSEWDWIAAPYIWAPTISTDLDVPPVGTRTNFANLIDKIDGAFLGRVESQNEQFGFLGDIVYLSLADSRSFERIQTSSDLDTTLMDLAGVWSPGSGRWEGFEVIGGLRYIDVDFAARLTPNNPDIRTVAVDIDKSYSDVLLGVRYGWRFGERWSATLRGDGSFGDTDGTWSVSALGGYRVKYGQWLFGYRYLSVELKNDRNSIDLTLDGVLAGFGFTF